MYQDQETLGRYLKRERESHLVPVEEIALFLGVNRSFIDALEGEGPDVFPRRSECLQLVKRYIAYLKLNQAEVLRLFDAEWKRTGGVQRYPKLTQFADGDASPVKSARYKGRRHLAGYLPARWVWLSVAAGTLIIISVLFIDLPDMKRKLAPPGQPHLAEKMIEVPPAKERIFPPVADAEPRTVSAPKRVSLPEAPRPRVAEAKIPPPPREARVIGNRDSKRYHLPGMKYYDGVKPYHRIVFQSETEAVRAGYRRARE